NIMEFMYSFVPKNDLSYSMERGYGFAMPALRSQTEDMRDSWPGGYFVPMVPTLLMDVPNGNYEVKLTIGSADQPGELTVKAGLGHLRLFEVRTAAGEIKVKKFAVHVQDGQLKLAFAGSSPLVQHVEVTRSTSIPTLFLA